jgi:hypothetical protein
MKLKNNVKLVSTPKKIYAVMVDPSRVTTSGNLILTNKSGRDVFSLTVAKREAKIARKRNNYEPYLICRLVPEYSI